MKDKVALGHRGVLGSLGVVGKCRTVHWGHWGPLPFPADPSAPGKPSVIPDPLGPVET